MRKRVVVRELMAGLVAENTLISYETAWEQYLQFAGSKERAIDAQTLLQWRQYMIEVKKYSAATINARIKAIKSIAHHLYGRRDIPREAYLELCEIKGLPKRALKDRRRPHNAVRIEPEQMRALVKAPPVSAENYIALRDRALLLTLATTGMRISEVTHIKVADLRDLGDGFYAIENVMTKAHSEPRTVPLSPEAYDAIMDWLEFRPVNSPWVFTGTHQDGTGGWLYSDKPLHRRTAAGYIKKYGEQIGLPHIKAHDFRRFVGTQLAKKDIRQAQKVLGHSDIRITAQYYVLDEIENGITNNLF